MGGSIITQPNDLCSVIEEIERKNREGPNSCFLCTCLTPPVWAFGKM